MWKQSVTSEKNKQTFIAKPKILSGKFAYFSAGDWFLARGPFVKDGHVRK